MLIQTLTPPPKAEFVLFTQSSRRFDLTLPLPTVRLYSDAYVLLVLLPAATLQAMGERVNQARSTIQYLKNTIEQVKTHHNRLVVRESKCTVVP